MGNPVDNKGNLGYYKPGTPYSSLGIPMGYPAGSKPDPVAPNSLDSAQPGYQLDAEEAERLRKMYELYSRTAHHERAHAASQAVVKPAQSERHIATTVNQGVQMAKYGRLTPATILLLQGQAAQSNPYSLGDPSGLSATSKTPQPPAPMREDGRMGSVTGTKWMNNPSFNPGGPIGLYPLIR